jgi:hypothetical protein
MYDDHNQRLTHCKESNFIDYKVTVKNAMIQSSFVTLNVAILIDPF